MNQNKSTHWLAIGVAISLVAATVFGGLYLLIWQGPKDVGITAKDAAVDGLNEGYDLLKRAGGDIYRALQFEPKVTIGGETVHGPSERITEIATASKDFSHTYTYEASWAGSTKRLELKGEFTAKAGFAVDDSFLIEIAGDGSKVTLHHKQPVLLSCELKKIKVLEDENGWWNKLQPEEREAAQNALLKRARERALDDELKAAAIRNLLERLKPLQEEHAFDTESKLLQ